MSIDLSSSPAGDTFEIDVQSAGVTISDGDIYVAVSENNSFMGIAIDNNSPADADDNWVYAGSWMTLEDAAGGDPDLEGNMGMCADPRLKIVACASFEYIAGGRHDYMVLALRNYEGPSLRSKLDIHSLS